MIKLKLNELVIVSFVLVLAAGCVIKGISPNKQKDKSSIVSVKSGEVVYGTDDRVEVRESLDSRYRLWARSTAAMISKKVISKGLFSSSENYKIKRPQTLVERFQVCKDEKFANQLAIGSCSGFLVGEDILVTAGHCMETKRDCKKNYWVFDFDNSITSNFPASLVYKCKEILKTVLDSKTRNDYAVIRLKRVVTDREPLRFRTTGKIAQTDPLVIIGHPKGLPSKVADNANVRNNQNPSFFTSTLDAFNGNSGSAVFNADSGLVEGILVRGESDYTVDRGRNCRVVKQCALDSCRGEHVTRITNLKDILTELGL